MINLKQLREAPEETKSVLAQRDAQLPIRLDAILGLDEQRRGILGQVEALKAERNTASEEVARLKKAKSDASELLARLKKLSDEIKGFDQSLRDIENELQEAMLRIPNLPLDGVPVGDARANTVLDTWGAKPSFNFEPKPHWEIAERLGLIDLARGAKVSGSGFPVYTGAGARLVRALINFMLDLHAREHDYTEVWPPALINSASALGTGQLPDLDSQMYLTGDELYLVPTAEVPVTNLHRDETLNGAELPKTYVAYSPCFRREAGAHGKETRGITRVHQFDKVELVRFCTPESSAQEHDRLLSHVTTVLQRLELPYRVLALATGDLGFASAKTLDVEAWAPGAEAWLEVSSASSYTDFQARRANIRYRPVSGGKPEFVHTLNASGLALPRTIIAMLENNQCEDGSVGIPAALVPYLGTERLTVSSA